jgi:LmbE family N-acetylglucosaminyl deacetylase
MAKTLAFVHAHPDDEALFTSLTSAHYAAAGDRCVLITMTDGQLGIDQEGRPGNHPEHDSEWVRHQRAHELAHVAGLVGFDLVVAMGFDDSGMRGWPTQEAPRALVAQPVDEVAAKVADVLNQVSADVVITYDENGYYGHPDHIATHDIVRAALPLAPTVERLFFPVTPAQTLREFKTLSGVYGAELPAWVTDAVGVNERDVHVRIDGTSNISLKRQAIQNHASQRDNEPLLHLPDELFAMLLGVEAYQLAWRRHDHLACAEDLLGGLL